MTDEVNLPLDMDGEGCRLISGASRNGFSLRLLTRALATDVDTIDRSCSGPDSKLNKARMDNTTPAVIGSVLKNACRTNVWPVI